VVEINTPQPMDVVGKNRLYDRYMIRFIYPYNIRKKFHTAPCMQISSNFIPCPYTITAEGKYEK
jgi:hypothetical protein